MFYCLYEIKNKINSKIYVGAHKTRKLDDNYMGSGKIIRAAIRKHGIENFDKRIIGTFDTAEEMYLAEASIVNDEFLQRGDVYNLRRGGTGGFEYLIKTNQHRSRFYRGIPLSIEQIEKTIQTKRTRFLDGKYDEARQKWSDNAKTNNPMFDVVCRDKSRKARLGVPKTDEHKQKISAALIGVSKKYPKNRKPRVATASLIVSCPHCFKEGGAHGMTRWHFDNCKFKQG